MYELRAPSTIVRTTCCVDNDSRVEDFSISAFALHCGWCSQCGLIHFSYLKYFGNTVHSSDLVVHRKGRGRCCATEQYVLHSHRINTVVRCTVRASARSSSITRTAQSRVCRPRARNIRVSSSSDPSNQASHFLIIRANSDACRSESGAISAWS